MACGDHVDVRRVLWDSNIWSEQTYFTTILVFLGDVSGSSCYRHVGDLRPTAPAFNSGNLVRGPACLHGVTTSCRGISQAGTQGRTTALIGQLAR